MGPRFLIALTEAAAERFGGDDPFVVACRQAASAANLEAARALLATLDPSAADALLAAVHKRMREDTSAVLAQWPGAPGAKPN